MNNSNRIMPLFVERLKELTEDGNITHKRLSKLIGCGDGSVSRWAVGVCFPSVRNIIGLTEYFKCSADFLLGRMEVPDYADFTLVASLTERLELLRREKGKTWHAVAVSIKMPEIMLYRWASGQYSPGVPGLIALADYFGCTVDYLIGRKF
jgi:transcriptional regulator with XRE-family HTH domain